MEKSGPQKTLKVISIVLIVLAAIGLLMGLVAIAGGAMIGAAGSVPGSTIDADQAMAAGVMTGAMGLVVIFANVVDLIIGILGLRGANDPSKIGPFYVMTIIGMVLTGLGVLSALFSGSDLSTMASNVISLALIVWCFVLARNIKGQQA
ncbi:MAG: hypothetical protein Q4D06_06630 [Coriobacteriia bacterium]|nr:hypothetical protein [Coriobacteriia bacterium]